jgi:hypothetical protein
MGALSNYGGLIEVALSFFGVSAFVWWQMRELKRDVAAREAREAADRADSIDRSNLQS